MNRQRQGTISGPAFVWLVISLAILCMLLTPFLVSRETLSRFMPPCPYKAKYHQDCPSCGLTMAFYHLSKGQFSEARRAHGFSPLIYGLFLANEAVFLLLVLRRRTRSSRGGRSQSGRGQPHARTLRAA